MVLRPQVKAVVGALVVVGFASLLYANVSEQDAIRRELAKPTPTVAVVSPTVVPTATPSATPSFVPKTTKFVPVSPKVVK